MKRIKSFFQRQNIQTRLIVWFLLISLLPLAWMTFISFEYARKLLLSQATSNLQALAFRQSQLIEYHFREREKTVLSFSKGNNITNALKAYTNALEKHGISSEEYQKVNQIYEDILKFRTDILGFDSLLLVNKSGGVSFSSLLGVPAGTNLLSEDNSSSSLKQIFSSALNFVEAQISAFTFYNAFDPPASFVATPIFEKEKVIGVAIAQISNTVIYRLINDYSGLGETGETILIAQMDNDLVTIAPVRYQEGSNPIQHLPLNSPLYFFVKKVLNSERLVDTVKDYRGQETLMVGRYFLPGLNWVVITKKDVDELLSPIDRLKWLSVFLGLSIAGIVALAASSVAQTIANPILLLIQKTRLLAAGDFSQRIHIKSENEFGRLATSFNDMADQLETTLQHMDTLVDQRTKQVEQQNIKLEQTIQELRQTQDRLINQEKLASLGALTAGIAHEIKNPLNFINNFAELSLQIDEDLKESIEKIRSQIPEEESSQMDDSLNMLKLNITKIYEHGKRADSIVHNMLYHSRGAPGEKIPTNLNNLLDEYVTLSYHGMRAQNSNFNVKLEKDYDKTLPLVPVVPQEISRVFLNLLNNAYYSINKKSQENRDYLPIVRITTKNHGDLVVIKIWDNGKGIPKDVFPKLFMPFFTTKPLGEGTGLGLSLSYNIIVHGHHGTLIADSQQGVFAEFMIGLPVEVKHF